jgi:Beta-lactamase enzyme family
MATRFHRPYAQNPSSVFWFIDPFTEGMIDQLSRNPRFANLAVMVIDLTLRPRDTSGAGFTTFAGWNMFDERFVASLAKIAAMFAAFRLKENLTQALTLVGSAQLKDALQAVTDDWKSDVEGSVPNGRPDFPHLTKIFKFTGGPEAWVPDFTKDYMDHLRNMIGHSNNHSASVCIDGLGYQYINGALKAEGLFSDEFGGLWLGSNYQGRNWKKEPIKNITHMGATAKSVAMFLSLLEEGRLVGSAPSTEMRKIMALAGTWFNEGLLRARPIRAGATAYAKVGLMGDCHDCAVIERVANGKTIRYAAVCLKARDPQVIRDLAVKLDDYVVASNVAFP